MPEGVYTQIMNNGNFHAMIKDCLVLLSPVLLDPLALPLFFPVLSLPSSSSLSCLFFSFSCPYFFSFLSSFLFLFPSIYISRDREVQKESR